MSESKEAPELLPCPFCGGPGESSMTCSEGGGIYTDRWAVNCRTCNYEMIAMAHNGDVPWYRQAKIESANKWNTRVAESTAEKLTQEIEWLRDHAICEQCDKSFYGPAGNLQAADVPICGDCWNKLAKTATAEKSEGWNEAIEAAAKVADLLAVIAANRFGYVSGNMGFENGRQKAAVEIAESIRALAVPLPPAEKSEGSGKYHINLDDKAVRVMRDALIYYAGNQDTDSPVGRHNQACALYMESSLPPPPAEEKEMK